MRLPVLRRLPDDAVHRAARALRQAAARRRWRVRQRRERARGRGDDVGGARHRRTRRHRVHRPGTVAHAGVVLGDDARRAPARGLQHGPGPGRLLPVHPRRRPRRLPPHRARADGHRRGRRAHPARLPPGRHVAQPGARVRRLPARAHVGGGRRLPHRLRAGAARRTGPSTARSAAPAAVASCRRSASASTATRARASRPTSRRWRPSRQAIATAEVRVETGFLEGAEFVVVAFGTAAKFVRYVVRQLRDEGVPIGYVRPITLWPFPYDAVAAAAEGARAVVRVRDQQRPDDRRRAPRRARARAGAVHRRDLHRQLGLRRGRPARRRRHPGTDRGGRCHRPRKECAT